MLHTTQSRRQSAVRLRPGLPHAARHARARRRHEFGRSSGSPRRHALRTFPKEISAAATSRELTPDEVAQFSRWLETGADDAQNAPDADEHFKCLKHAWLSKPYARDLRVTKTHLSTHDWTARMTNAWPLYDILSIERKRGARVIFIELPGSLFRRRSRLEVRLPSDEDAMRLAERLVAAAPDAKALC